MLVSKRLQYFAFFIVIFFGVLGQTKILDKLLAFLANPQLDVTSYHFDITIPSIAETKFSARMDMSVASSVDSEEIELHFERNYISIQRIIVNGKEASFSILKGIPNDPGYGLSGDVLSIENLNVKANEINKVSIFYDLSLNSQSRGLFKSGANKLLTLGWPYYSRFWFPSNDSPLDAANVSYSLHVPNNLTAIANGKLVSTREELGGLKTFNWVQAKPTTTYNFVFSVGKFGVYKEEICFNLSGEIDNKRVACNIAERSVPLEIYYDPESTNADQIVAQIKKDSDSLIYFSKLFGDYEFEKLGFLYSRYPFSMESTSLIVLTSLQSAVHEIVHHWWGNNVHIPHWGDFWISEGFTTYVTGLYSEYLTGKNSSCLDNSSTDKLNNPSSTDPNDIFNNIPYCKGAASIHALRLGLETLSNDKAKATPAFLKMLSELYKTYKGKALSTEGFVTFVQKNATRVYLEKGINLDEEELARVLKKWRSRWYGLN